MPKDHIKLDEAQPKEEIPQICQRLDRFVYKICGCLSILSVVLVAIILVQVFLRYTFSISFPQLEELQWHLYAVVIMFGLSFTMINNAHVRVDILRTSFSADTQRKIEIIGILLVMFPFMFIVIDYGYDFTVEAIRVNERSDAPGGLPYRWIIKSVIPISFLLLFTVSLSRLIRHSVYLMKRAN